MSEGHMLAHQLRQISPTEGSIVAIPQAAKIIRRAAEVLERRAPMTAPTPAGEEGDENLQRCLWFVINVAPKWADGAWSELEPLARALLSSPRVEEAIPFNKTDLAQLQQVREELRNRWRASAWQLLCRTIDDLEARAALSLQVEGTKP